MLPVESSVEPNDRIAAMQARRPSRFNLRQFIQTSAGALAALAGVRCSPQDAVRLPEREAGAAAADSSGGRPDGSALATVNVASAGIARGIVDVEPVAIDRPLHNARPRPNSSGRHSTPWDAYRWEWA